jgi:hypothetical protein
MGNRVNGGARTVEKAGDVGGRVAIGDKQHDVHAQPTAGLSLALHRPDKFLVLSFGEGDTLHIWAVLRVVADRFWYL